MFGRHRARSEGLLDAFDEAFVDIFENDLDLLAVKSQQPVAHQRRHPEAALLVERESVGEESAVHGEDCFPDPKSASRSNRAAAHPSPERLDDVEPLAGRVRPHFIGVAEAVGDDARPVGVDEHDEPVSDVRRARPAGAARAAC